MSGTPELQEIILTEAPEWLLNKPAFLDTTSGCVQPAAIAPWYWYAAKEMKWRLRVDTDPLYTCRKCFKQVHLLCKDLNECRDCARLHA